MKKARKIFRLIVLILVLLTTPFACVGMGSIIFSLPGMNSVGFFHGEVRVENNSSEALYLTPISTTYAEPRIITQPLFRRHRDLPLGARDSIVITFDTADFSLAGIILCDEDADCRSLEYDWQNIQTIDDFDALPPVDASWLAVRDVAFKYNFQLFMITGFALTPFALLAFWWRLGRREENEV